MYFVHKNCNNLIENDREKLYFFNSFHSRSHETKRQTNRVWLSIKYTVWQQSYMYRVHLQYIGRAVCNSTIFEFTSIIHTWLSVDWTDRMQLQAMLLFIAVIGCCWFFSGYFSTLFDSFVRSFVLYHCLFASLKWSSRINSLCALLFMLVRFRKTENFLPVIGKHPFFLTLLYFVWAITHIEQNPFTQ